MDPVGFSLIIGIKYICSFGGVFLILTVTPRNPRWTNETTNPFDGSWNPFLEECPGLELGFHRVGEMVASTEAAAASAQLLAMEITQGKGKKS